MPRRGEKAFRLRTQRVFLTYPKWADAESEDNLPCAVRAQIEDLCGKNGIPQRDQLEGGIVARELHADRTVHIHAVLVFRLATECRDKRAFDIGDRHPNIQAVKGLARCVKYCRKAGTYVAWGSCDQPLSRAEILQKLVHAQPENPIAAVVEAVDQCEGLITGYKRLKADYLQYLDDKKGQPEWYPMTVYWVYGASGIGKSRWADQKWPKAYRLMENGTWFENYYGQEVLIIDEIDPHYWRHKYLLSCTQGYRQIIQIKNGSVFKRWTTVVITSVDHPEMLYPNSWKTGELKRRITHLVNFENPLERWIIDPSYAPPINHEAVLLMTPPPSPIGSHWI